MATTNELDLISRHIAHAAFAIHGELGAGLDKRVYLACMTYELEERGLRVEHDVTFPVRYHALVIDSGFKVDLFVNRQVLVDLVSDHGQLPERHEQMFTHLKAADLRLGYLLSFNVANINEGLQRVVL